MIAALDKRSGRERSIFKAATQTIIISNFAVVVCCERAAKYLKQLRKDSLKINP